MKLSGRILFIVTTAVIVFSLSFAMYLITKGKVEENEAEKRVLAFEAVWEGADSFDEATYRTDYLQRFLDEKGYADDQVFVNGVTFARDSFRDVQGIVVQVSSYKKYGGIITMLVGLKNDGTVNGYSILSISDAKGLDRKVRDPEFEEQFENVKTDAFTLVNYSSSQPSEIVAANGAEDASLAVVRAVNAAILTNQFIDEYYGETLS